ncbi:imelysin family protein [Rhizobium sp. SAFR-030]|uniref:imelysin family protein n=1 Tax=Rhizobium sp. SAFR-030 TaxID=3387277 RepID=UPI003F7F70BC
MRRLIAAFLMAALVSTSSTLAQDAPPAAAPQLTMDQAKTVMAKVVDGFIRPGYRRFAASSATLTDSMLHLCSSPSEDELNAARHAFETAALDWGQIEIVRVGPVIDEARFERILFYPDRKGTGLRQVQALLAKPDDIVTTPDGLSTKSVAMQGLGALEFLLYGTDAETLSTQPNGFRCRYALAVAGNMQRVATELARLWDEPDGVQNDWKNPGRESASFYDAGEAITELLGILVHAAETVRDQRIETFYKGENGKTFPRQALFWRSDLTFPMLAANLKGIRMLLDTSDIEELLKPDQQPIVASIDADLDALLHVVSTVNPEVEIAVAQPEQRQKLDALLQTSRDLILRLNDKLGGGLGLGAGFSFSDGD